MNLDVEEGIVGVQVWRPNRVDCYERDKRKKTLWRTVAISEDADLVVRIWF